MIPDTPLPFHRQDTEPFSLNFTASAITFPHPVVRVQKPQGRIVRAFFFSMPFLAFLLLLSFLLFMTLVMIAQTR